MHSSMLELPARHVHLWCLTIDRPTCDLAFLVSLLSADERVRADRFRYQRDREFFIWYRGKLRRILASYFGSAPQELRYRIGQFGKPELAEPFDLHQLRFSISHSGNCVMIAVARQSEVGVDIEQIRPISDLLEVANNIFSRRERALFLSLEESRKLQAFFSIWTQKEAYLKARGLGLSRPPQDVDIDLFPVQGSGLFRDHWDLSAAKQWSLTAWSSMQSYAAALAIEGHDWHINSMVEGYLSV